MQWLRIVPCFDSCLAIHGSRDGPAESEDHKSPQAQTWLEPWGHRLTSRNPEFFTGVRLTVLWTSRPRGPRLFGSLTLLHHLLDR